MVEIAFNAGSIEATLTLNRNPFQEGLKLAKAEAKKFAENKYEVELGVKTDQKGLAAFKKQLEAFARKSYEIKFKTVVDKSSMTALVAELKLLEKKKWELKLGFRVNEAQLLAAQRAVEKFAEMNKTARAKVDVDRAAFDKLVKDLREFGKIRVSARASVDVNDANLRRLEERLRRFGASRSTARADIDASGMSGHFGQTRILIMAIIALLPMIGSAIVSLIGLVGALTSAFVVAGAAAGAWALVAVPAFKKVKDAVEEGQAAIDKLPKGLREAAMAMRDMNKGYEELQKRTQGGVGFAMAAGFRAATTAMKTLDPIINAASKTFESLANQVNKYLGSPHWKNFVTFVASNLGPVFQHLFDILVYFTRAVMNIAVAFKPLMDIVLPAIANGLKQFADWIAKVSKTQEFQNWLKLAATSLEAFWKWLVAAIQFIFNLSTALAPLGNAMFNFFTGLFNALSKLPPEWLSAIAVALGAIFLAMMLGAGGPVALAIGAVLGLATALHTLYEKNEKVRQVIDTVFKAVKDFFAPIWKTVSDNFNNKIIPAVDNLVTAFKTHMLPVLNDLWIAFKDKVLPTIQPIADTITGKLIPAVLDFLAVIQPAIAWLVANIGPQLIRAFETLFLAIDGGLRVITGIIQAFIALFKGDWEGLGKALETISDGFLSIIGSLFGLNLDEMKQVGADFRAWFNQEWIDMWGGIKTEQDGSQTHVNGAWNDLWQGMGTWFKDTFVTDTQNDWVNFWGGVKTEQDGSQTAVNGKWHDMWGSIGTWFKDVFVTDTANDWINFWGGVKAEQDGSQVVVQGKWHEMWGAINTWFHDTFVVDTQNDWVNFWGGVKTEQDGSQTQVKGSWTQFWEDVNRIAADIWAAITGTINSALTTIESAVREAGARIGTAWRAIANFFREPINWVIRVVVNDGVLKAWNTVMGWIGQPGLSASPLGELPAFARGGNIRGPGSGTSDSILALVSNDEYIVKAKVARQNRHFLDALNNEQPEAMQAAGARANGGLSVQYPRFAAGGVAHAQSVASAMNGKPYIWGGAGPGGADCSGYQSIITNALRGAANPYSRLGTTATFPWGGFVGGLGSSYAVGAFKGNPGHMAGTLGGVNVEAGGSPSRVKYGAGAVGADHGQFGIKAHLPEAGGVFAGGGGGLVEMLVSWWSQIGGKVTDLFKGIFGGSIPGVGGVIGEAMNRIPAGIVGKSLDAIRAKLEKLMTSIFVQSTGGTAVANASDMAVVDQVAAVAARYGWPKGSAEWTALFQLIQKESSWNPNAANPTSSARGLFQKMTSIHGPVEGTAGGQAEWGLNYIRSRYGSPSAALAFHRANNYYDNGGILPPGITTAINMTGQREFVNTPKQVENLFNAGHDVGMDAQAKQDRLQAIIAAQSNERVVEKLDALLEMLERRGAGATINMQTNATDPREAARATVLGLRLS